MSPFWLFAWLCTALALLTVTAAAVSSPSSKAHHYHQQPPPGVSIPIDYHLSTCHQHCRSPSHHQFVEETTQLPLRNKGAMYTLFYPYMSLNGCSIFYNLLTNVA